MRNLIRGRIIAVHDNGDFQSVDIEGLAGERFTNVYRPQAHGLHSVPMVGAEGWVMFSGGLRELAVAVGFESRDKRPSGLGDGATAIYGPTGEIASIVKKKIRLAAETVELVGTKIILDGTVYLGGSDANRQLALKDSVDTANNRTVANLATKVYGK